MMLGMFQKLISAATQDLSRGIEEHIMTVDSGAGAGVAAQ